jgi:hypothetical protein
MLLVWGIYGLRHWNELRRHDIPTDNHGEQFSHLGNITVIIATISENIMLILLIEDMYEVHL